MKKESREIGLYFAHLLIKDAIACKTSISQWIGLVYMHAYAFFLCMPGSSQRKATDSKFSTFLFPTGKDSKERTSSKLGLPLSYDRRYKINLALLSKDVTDVTGYSTTGTKKGIN